MNNGEQSEFCDIAGSSVFSAFSTFPALLGVSFKSIVFLQPIALSTIEILRYFNIVSY